MMLVHGHARRSAMAEQIYDDIPNVRVLENRKCASRHPATLEACAESVSGVLWAARLNLCRVELGWDHGGKTIDLAQRF